MKAKKVYEALSDVLKPKSNVEIDNVFKVLSPQHQFNIAVSKGMDKKAKEIFLKYPDEINPAYGSGQLIYNAVEENRPEMLEFLLQDDRSIEAAQKIAGILKAAAITNNSNEILDILIEKNIE